MLIITIIGLVTVFLVFTILYFVFLLFGFFSKKAAIKLPQKIESHEDLTLNNEEEEEEEIAAIMAAIYSMLGSVTIKKIYKKNENRGWTIWKKTGWRGVKGWSKSSKLG
ncbi:OadG family protein [Thermosipho sp. 1223]|uniref:OadG family protein n=1 Tax=Thermosipho sp. 1223 TaxID=1643332 RepID=UPI0009871D18|nr:OadG family protein [Thermosipho sp. 1223]OOC46444.1 hypothetical protein XO09_06435 [Thermosipho sp. 1223]